MRRADIRELSELRDGDAILDTILGTILDATVDAILETFIEYLAQIEM